MKYIQTYDEINEKSGLRRGLASLALGASIACTTPSCKVKDNWETLVIENPDYSNKRGEFGPGDEVSIEIPAHSNIKEYVLTVSDGNGKDLYETDGELKGPNGVSIYYRIPQKYTGSVLVISLYGKNKLGKDFKRITRTVNVVH